MLLYGQHKTEIIFTIRLILLGLYSIFTLYITTNVLSSEDAALYLSLFAIVMFATVADSGFSSSIMHFVSKSSVFNARNEITQIRDLQFLNLVKSITLVGLLLNILFGMLVFFYIYMFVDVPIIFNFLLAYIFFMYCCQIQVKALIEGLGFVYQSSLASLFATVIAVSLASICLYEHKIQLSISLFFICNILIFLVKTYDLWFIVVRQSIFKGQLDRTLLSKFLKHAVGIGLVWFFGYLNGYGTILIAKLYKNDEFVIEVGQLNMIMVQLSMLLSVFLISKQANLGYLWKRSKMQALRQLVRTIEFKTLTLWSAIFIFISIAIVSSELVSVFLVSSPMSIFAILLYLLFYIGTFIKGTAIRYATGEYMQFWMPVFTLLNVFILIVSPVSEVYIWCNALIVGSLNMCVTYTTFLRKIKRSDEL